MDWDKLRIFKIVVEAGSFTSAGEILNLSQSSISRQISALEENLNIPLFNRHARGLILTEQGEILYQTSCEIFEKIQLVETKLSDSRALPTGKLTITTLEFIAATWLAPKIGEFKEKYPDIEITMLLDDRIYDLEMHEADVALRFQKSRNNNLIERHMMTINFVLCASKKYLSKNGYPNNIKDFQKHIMIGYPPNIRTPFPKPNWIFSHFNINMENNPNIIFINSLQARYSAIKSGAGISTLPYYIAASDDEIEILYPDLEIPNIEMYFVYPQEKRNSKKVIVLKDFLTKHIKQQEAMQ